MTASAETTRRVIEILRKHLDKITLRDILLELREVPGNRSFTETIITLEVVNEMTP